MKKRKAKTMLEVTKGYEGYIERKQINASGKALFDKAIKKALTKPKERGSK